MRITLRPDASLLGAAHVDALLLAQHLHDAAVYLSGLCANLVDERSGERHAFGALD